MQRRKTQQTEIRDNAKSREGRLERDFDNRKRYTRRRHGKFHKDGERRERHTREIKKTGSKVVVRGLRREEIDREKLTEKGKVDRSEKKE